MPFAISLVKYEKKIIIIDPFKPTFYIKGKTRSFMDNNEPNSAIYVIN